MPNENNVRPTKKQKQLLSFIEAFIHEHGYSPAYREIMRGCGYNSVATVALHVSSLIARGHLRKRDRSARSLEVVNPQLSGTSRLQSTLVGESEEKWLVDQINLRIKQLESSGSVSRAEIANIEILVQSLRILGLDAAANACTRRLAELDASKLE